MEEVDLSILIVNRDGASLLEACLDSIFSQPKTNFTFEVLVADNGSTDDSEALVRSKYPQVIWQSTGGDRGYGFAHNLSAGKARGRKFFFMANDIKLPGNFFEVLWRATSGLNFEGFITTNQKNYDGSVEIRAAFGLDIFGFPCLSERALDYFFNDGSSILVDRDAFFKIGQFDSVLYLFYEDIDLFWRARVLGIPIVSRPEIFVYHKGGATVSGGHFRGEAKYATTALRRYLNERNAIRNLLKNYSLPYLLPIIFLYFFLSLAEMAFLFSLNRNLRVVKSYSGAWLWNLFNLPNTLSFRKKVQSQRKVSDREIVKLMYKGYGKLLTVRKIGLPVIR